MTLEEAIAHLDESLNDQGHDWGCEECKQEHIQLREWLVALKVRRDREDKPNTNADWLRTLSDEALCNVIINGCTSDALDGFLPEDGHCTADCDHCVATWLKREHKEAHDGTTDTK